MFSIQWSGHRSWIVCFVLGKVKKYWHNWVLGPRNAFSCCAFEIKVRLRCQIKTSLGGGCVHSPVETLHPPGCIWSADTLVPAFEIASDQFVTTLVGETIGKPFVGVWTESGNHRQIRWESRSQASFSGQWRWQWSFQKTSISCILFLLDWSTLRIKTKQKTLSLAADPVFYHILSKFGRGPCVNSVPQEMVDLCLSKKLEVDSTNAGVVFNAIDTAYMYTGGQVSSRNYSRCWLFFAQSEQILGDIGAWKGKTAMATKVLTFCYISPCKVNQVN